MKTSLLSPHNHLFELARLGRRRLNFIPDKMYPVLAFIFALLAPILGSICVVPLALLAYARSGEVGTIPSLFSDPNLNTAILLIASFSPIFCLIWGWLWLIERRHLWTIGLEWSGWWQKYIRGLGVGLVMFSASVGLMALLGYTTRETGSAQPTGPTYLGGVLLIFLGWIVQGAAEEILTRGFLLPVIGIRWGPGVGVALSSLLFAVLHLLNPNLSPIALFNLFLFGVFVSFYALWEGSVWGIFAIHSVWNWAQGNFFGFEVSGQGLNTATLFNLQEAGPDWFTGGSFGPEGGLAVTLVLVVSSVLVWLVQQRRVNDSQV
jgi:hypothetical protein